MITVYRDCFKHSDDHELDVKDPPNQTLNVYDQFTKSGDHTASSEIIHGLDKLE